MAKRNFADVIRDCEMGRLFGLSRWAQCYPMGCKMENLLAVVTERDAMMGARSGGQGQR